MWWNAATAGGPKLTWCAPQILFFGNAVSRLWVARRVTTNMPIRRVIEETPFLVGDEPVWSLALAWYDIGRQWKDTDFRDISVVWGIFLNYFEHFSAILTHVKGSISYDYKRSRWPLIRSSLFSVAMSPSRLELGGRGGRGSGSWFLCFSDASGILCHRWHLSWSAQGFLETHQLVEAMRTE